MKLCTTQLQCSIALGVETIAVSSLVSISVIGLIIDAPIPAGAGRSARNTVVAEGRVRLGEGTRDGGISGRQKWWNRGEQEKTP